MLTRLSHSLWPLRSNFWLVEVHKQCVKIQRIRQDVIPVCTKILIAL